MRHTSCAPSLFVEPAELQSSRKPWQRKAFIAVKRLARASDKWLARAADRMCSAFLRRVYGNGISYRTFSSLGVDYSSRRNEQQAHAKRLFIVVVAYKQALALDCLLASLRCQTMQNFDVLVLHDGPDAESRAVVERHMSSEGQSYFYEESEVRFNDWGHTLRNMGVRRADREFVLITNGDNYYSPKFVQTMFEAIDAGKLDMALCNMVHSHIGPDQTRAPPNYPMQVFPVRFHCDIGSVIARTSLAQVHGFRDRAHDADATYLEDMLRSGEGSMAIGKVSRTLLVHN